MHKLATVSRVVGVPAATIASWIDRGLVELGSAPGTGTPRNFTRDDVNRVAVIAEMVQLGVSVANAANAGSAFTDEGSQGRSRGQVHEGGKTILLVTADGASVHCVYDGASFDDAMSKLFSEERTAIVVSLSEIIRRVERALAGGTSSAGQRAGAIYRHGQQLHA